MVAMHEYGRTRRRDGAYEWAIFRDTEISDRYLEIFLVNSWAEHLRQHERQTQADRALEAANRQLCFPRAGRAAFDQVSRNRNVIEQKCSRRGMTRKKRRPAHPATAKYNYPIQGIDLYQRPIESPH